MRLLPFFARSCGCLLLAGLLACPAAAIVIQIDYSYDTGNYFSAGSVERTRLEEAAVFFEDILIDDLDAITPTGNYSTFTPESWQINFTNPTTGGIQTVDDVAIAADTIILYVGARTYSGTQLAEAGFGGASTFSFTGSDFDKAVKTRGQTDVGNTDFAPWGGFLSVNDTTSWDTSLDGGGIEQHLYSTLLHEIAHVLGLGTAASWDNQVSGGSFTGAASIAEYGGNVPLHFTASNGRYDHWENGTMSTIWGTATEQEVALDPEIATGDVKLFTALDIAGLDDVGWDIAEIPEPRTGMLLGTAIALLVGRRRRRY
ncbi:MAG: PEP-CTERM sorting domain-containing protein [Verrucomicrobiales bacterium]